MSTCRVATSDAGKVPTTLRHFTSLEALFRADDQVKVLAVLLIVPNGIRVNSCCSSLIRIRTHIMEPAMDPGSSVDPVEPSRRSAKMGPARVSVAPEIFNGPLPVQFREGARPRQWISCPRPAYSRRYNQDVLADSEIISCFASHDFARRGKLMYVPIY
ncbi:hypothetical protein VTK56DRAFT_328 [Thermocarpiscus australiensis]